MKYFEEKKIQTIFKIDISKCSKCNDFHVTHYALHVNKCFLTLIFCYTRKIMRDVQFMFLSGTGIIYSSYATGMANAQRRLHKCLHIPF